MRAPGIERKPRFRPRAAESPDPLTLFKNGHVVAPFVEQASERYPGETATQYRRFHAYTVYAETIYG
ncbi:hypothetical protein MchiMG62_12150 [Methanoculleus chikugoensis]|uniref:Uncharacterized protein n=1 Tax=Methanoculleus chikugoensis TaxID=118126 RepID=A0ABN5XLV6_9EURY|nr:hypothetical protein MchiMG62_12150 [Methanoculleus chikugoensis]